MWKRILPAFLPMLFLLAIPFCLRVREPAVSGKADDTLVIVTPHTEQIRYEFDHAFRTYYQKKTGRKLYIDWRNVGGTSDAVHYISDRFEAVCRENWIKAGHKWNEQTAKDYKNSSCDPDDVPVRKFFLEMDKGIGVDIFFGGGAFDMGRFAKIGIGVPGGVEQRHPEWFASDVIPVSHAGESVRDPQGRYYGVCLASFGISYNPDRYKDLGLPPPQSWADLACPELFNLTEVADPTKSGSVNKCYEMIVQQSMQQNGPSDGWLKGFCLLKRIAANSRNVTDSAGKLVRDVSAGTCAAGMSIDFYGFNEAEFSRSISRGRDRLIYVMPKNGSSISSDPIQLLRGAPNKKIAEMFLDFVLSPEGQSLWFKKPGTPNGPVKTGLQRPPVRMDLYDKVPEDENLLAGYNPYKSSGGFIYRGEWTGRYFNLIRVLIKCIALDPIDDLRDAWGAIIANGGEEKNPEAVALLNAMPFTFEQAPAANAALYAAPAKSARVRREWTEFARRNYRKAAELARKEKK